MPISITRQFGFDAGHRVLRHESKCATLHGHRYTAEVTVQAPELDALGRVIDFSVLKTIVGGWLDEHWDHTMILHEDDPLAFALRSPHVLVSHVAGIRAGDLLGPRPVYILSGKRNPTAENLAEELATVATDLLAPHSLTVTQVRLWETPNCYADWRKHEHRMCDGVCLEPN